MLYLSFDRLAVFCSIGERCRAAKMDVSVLPAFLALTMADTGLAGGRHLS